MKPKFFTDTHVGNVAIEQLRSRGLDILRCQEVGLEDAKDIDLLSYATQNRRVMVSCDQDFEQIHYDYMGKGIEHAGIIYMNQEEHCQHIGEIVRILWYYYEISERENDLYNKFWRGKDAE